MTHESVLLIHHEQCLRVMLHKTSKNKEYIVYREKSETTIIDFDNLVDATWAGGPLV